MTDQAAEAYRLLVADVYELAGRSRATSEAIAQRHQQTAARWHLLSVLRDEAMTVPGIARRLGQSRQSVQRVADDLIAAGCVRWRPTPATGAHRCCGSPRTGSASSRRSTRTATRTGRPGWPRPASPRASWTQARQVLRALTGALDGPKYPELDLVPGGSAGASSAHQSVPRTAAT